MNTINKENITQLTKNGIRELLEKRRKGMVLQLLEIQKINKKDDIKSANSDKFRVILSDGDAKVRCILGNKAAKVAEQFDLKEYSVVQINEHLYNNNENKNPIIIITEIDVVNSNINESIGAPLEFQSYQANNYANPAGNNQIPAKYLKSATPIVNKPNNMMNNQPTKQNNTFQQNMKPASNSVSNQLSKGNVVGNYNTSNANDGIREQNSYNSKMSNGMNSGQSYQRTATFGNQSTATSRNSSNNRAVNNFSSPHKKLSELSLDDFTPISALVGFSSGFTIKAKITKKTDIRTYNKNGSEGCVFSIEIVDNDGGEIQGSFFGDAAREFHPKLQEGHVYIFSGGNVKVANTKFQTVKNEYQIMFDKSTQVEEVADDGTIASPNFNFISLNQVGELDVNTNVDILALVKEAGNVTQITLKNNETKPRRVIEVYDRSLHAVELTLWGDLAEKCNLKKNEVIAGRALRIGEFMGKKNLSFSSTTSQIFWGSTLPMNPQVEEIVEWRDNTNVEDNEFVQISKSGERPTRFTKTLDQVEEESNMAQSDNQKKFDWVKVYVSHIKTDNSMYYPACPNEKCMKKVNTDNGENRCFNCQTEFDRPSLRYTLSMKIEDASNCIWVTAFSKEAEAILGASAEQVKDYKDSGNDTKLADLVKEASCYEWKMNVSTKLDYNNGMSKVRYQVVRCIKMDYARETKTCLKMLELYGSAEN